MKGWGWLCAHHHPGLLSKKPAREENPKNKHSPAGLPNPAQPCPALPSPRSGWGGWGESRSAVWENVFPRGGWGSNQVRAELTEGPEDSPEGEVFSFQQVERWASESLGSWLSCRLQLLAPPAPWSGEDPGPGGLMEEAQQSGFATCRKWAEAIWGRGQGGVAPGAGLSEDGETLPAGLEAGEAAAVEIRKSNVQEGRRGGETTHVPRKVPMHIILCVCHQPRK